MASFSDPQKNVFQWDLPLGAWVADFGSGSGHYIKVLSKVVGSEGRVFAVDIQKDLLEKVKNEANKGGRKNVEVVLGDLEKSGGSHLKEAYLDGVVISNLFFQADNKEQIIKESARILKKEGTVLVVDWSDSFGGLGPQAESIFSKEKVLEIFGRHGFSLVKEIDAGVHHYGVILKRV
jgi:ubiquinone/menaquinone biosynthesis C-methylase UbiE